MIFPKEAPIRKRPLETAVAVLAAVFICGLIFVAGALAIFGVKGIIGGYWR